MTAPASSLPAAPTLPPGAASGRPLSIAVVGTGIAGLSAAWLLSSRHDVSVFEADSRPGGHSHTVDVPRPGGAARPVDTGFIVYNEPSYPNLTALFTHLGVPTRASEMSFAVSLDDGALEYAGRDLAGLLAQPGNLLRPRFWSMLRDLVRFYRVAAADRQRGALADDTSLDDYLAARGFGAPFRDDHLYPMAAAIWSQPAEAIGRFPAASFIRFCENHRLLQLTGRPVWRTVEGGSRAYVQRLCGALGSRLRLDSAVRELRRGEDGVQLRLDAGWHPRRFDAVVVATHADDALALLADPSDDERRLLGAIPYRRNLAVLHRDPALMPRRRAAWSSWNYVGPRGAADAPTVTYWMNRLQGLDPREPLFVTLNPRRQPRPEHLVRTDVYAHPVFDVGALAAQRELWRLQGRTRTWYCGAWFGHGFHEDGLQAGLAAAEALGGVRRPWRVADESGRIHLAPSPVSA